MNHITIPSTGITMPAMSPGSLIYNGYSIASAGPTGVSACYNKINYYSIEEQVDIKKREIRILNKVAKIDSDAKEIHNDYESYDTLMTKSFLSEKIWQEENPKICFSVRDYITSTLSIFKEIKCKAYIIKLYACHQLPIITKLSPSYAECYIENMNLLEKNKKIAQKISKEVAYFVKINNLKINSDSEISDTLGKYINFL